MALPPLVLRSAKGAALTTAEFDGNHERHEARIDGILGDPPAAVTITNVTQAGTVITFHTSDEGSFPVTLPQSAPSAPVRATVITSIFTPALSDSGLWIPGSHATGIEVTLPGDGEVAFPVRTTMIFQQIGVGPISFVGGSGVEAFQMPSSAAPETAERYSIILVKKTASNTWALVGDFGLADEETDATS